MFCFVQLRESLSGTLAVAPSVLKINAKGALYDDRGLVLALCACFSAQLV